MSMLPVLTLETAVNMYLINKEILQFHRVNL